MPQSESTNVIDAIRAAAIVVNAEGVILETNDAFSRLAESSRQALNGRPLSDLFGQVDLLLDAFPSEPGETKLKVVRTDFRDPKGTLRSLSLGLTDLHGELPEEPLRLLLVLAANGADSALPLDTLVDDALVFAKVVSWVLYRATSQIQFSRSCNSVWGFGGIEEDNLDLDFYIDKIHPQDQSRVRSILAELSPAEPSARFRFRIIRPDGEVRWAESTAQLLPEAVGLGECLYGAVLDITERHFAEQALERYADIVAASSDRIAFIDGDGILLAANIAFCNALPRRDESVIGQHFQTVCGRNPLSTLLSNSLGRCLENAEEIAEDIAEAAGSGRQRDLEVRLFPHRDRNGVVTGAVVNVRDVTQIREAERKLLHSSAVFSASSEGVVITDPMTNIVAVNAAFTQITGYTESEVLGRRPTLLSSQWHPYSFFVSMWRRVRRYGLWQGEVWNRRKDGEVYLQRLTIKRVCDSRGKLVSYVGVFAERTSPPDGPQRAEHLLHYDALTRLPNRLLFESRVEHAIQLARRKESPIVVFVIDLDHFSHVNTSLSHQIGDELLRTVAWKLREAIRPSDTLARFRADEFALLFEEINQVEEVAEIARRIQRILHTTMDIKGHQIFVTVSVGIVFDTRLACDETTLIDQAEAVLRRVQKQGGKAFRISTVDPTDAAQEHRRLLLQLRAGLDRGEYQLLYRRRVDMEDLGTECAEAVIRWTQPDIGTVPPERFLPLANDSGFMVELGEWALDHACAQLESWMQSGLPLKCLSLNIAEAQLTRGDLLRTLKRLVDDHPLIADRLELEFNEHLIQRHREQVAEVFQGIANLGIGIILAEVGGGWMAPAVLQRLPVQALKIHPSFVECLPDSKPDLAVVEAIIAMAQALDIEVRADGVRSDAQRHLLLTIGCQQGLGDLFGEPENAKTFAQRLSDAKDGKSPPPPRN